MRLVKAAKAFPMQNFTVKVLPIVNDAAESALGLPTKTNFKTCPQTEVKLQAFYKVIKGVREKLRKQATSNETVIKKSLSAVKYHWD